MGAPMRALQELGTLLGSAGIAIDGAAPYDLQVHDERFAELVLAKGNLGLGESYMAGWWDCGQLDEFFHRVLRARLDRKVRSSGLMAQGLISRLRNPQSPARAWEVGQRHYDLGNAFFADMLDSRMAYSCGYWKDAHTLDQAQERKLDLVCRKLGLREGMRVLDIGCGWGSFMRFAAERYGVTCVGVTVSKEQADYGKETCKYLPVTFLLQDYRSLHSGDFDRVASIGMFEHVGGRNYRDFFAVARRNLKPDGLFLLHTIGSLTRNAAVDRWIERYIFPNGEIPALGQIADACQGAFVIEDIHNFGADYDPTLMAWHENFKRHWPKHRDRYPAEFERMWSYYLLSCAGSFRARSNQLWQVVLSPEGVSGGYRRPH